MRIVLTAVTTVLEIAAGCWTGSMALVADGWHMATEYRQRVLESFRLGHLTIEVRQRDVALPAASSSG
jgi:Co/Zn/Cd efflux system component